MKQGRKKRDGGRALQREEREEGRREDLKLCGRREVEMTLIRPLSLAPLASGRTKEALHPSIIVPCLFYLLRFMLLGQLFSLVVINPLCICLPHWVSCQNLLLPSGEVYHCLLTARRSRFNLHL